MVAVQSIVTTPYPTNSDDKCHDSPVANSGKKVTFSGPAIDIACSTIPATGAAQETKSIPPPPVKPETPDQQAARYAYDIMATLQSGEQRVAAYNRLVGSLSSDAITKARPSLTGSIGVAKQLFRESCQHDLGLMWEDLAAGMIFFATPTEDNVEPPPAPPASPLHPSISSGSSGQTAG